MKRYQLAILGVLGLLGPSADLFGQLHAVDHLGLFCLISLTRQPRIDDHIVTTFVPRPMAWADRLTG
jgi:hypothetical protein